MKRTEDKKGKTKGRKPIIKPATDEEICFAPGVTKEVQREVMRQLNNMGRMEKPVVLVVRIESSRREALRLIAFQERRSTAALVRWVLARYLNSKQPRRGGNF